MPPFRRFLVAIAIAACVVAACGGAGPTDDGRPPTLANTAWRALTVNGQATVPGSEPTAAFTQDQVSGSSGCNSYSGGYAYDPATGAISFRELSTTLMMCAEPAKNAAEAAFNKALGAATSATVDELGHLVLSGPGGEIALAVDAVGS